MRTFFVFLLLALWPAGLYAQSSNPQKAYLNGKDLYNSGKYALAIEAFKPLTTYTNSFTEYATYFYALSAYHDRQVDIAKNILLQLTRKYPNWSKKGEALLWLGKVYLEKEEYNQGITTLREIRDRSMAEPVRKIKVDHLLNAEVATLKELNSQFPNDEGVAEALARKLAQTPMSPEDQILFSGLVEKFKLVENEISDQVVGPTTKKDQYRVAVCFPFMANNLKSDIKSNSNQWVLDMYQGIKIGQQKLKRQNVSVELYAYDTERDSTVTAGIFSEDEMGSMDLVIGPLYPKPSELAANFSFSNKVNILNPLSSNMQIVANNPYSFLYNPGDATKARAAAEFMLNRIEKDKKTLIISGSRTADSIAAHTYQQILLDNDLEVLMMDPIPTSDAEEIARFVTEGLMEILGDGEKPPTEDVGHIYVASSNELIIANVIGTVDNTSLELNIMGNESWLRSRYIDFQQLERMQVFMTAPNFVDYNSDKFKEFQKAYLSAVGSIPNRFSFIGYDMMLLFGRLLHEGGNYFQHELQDQEFISGTLFPGFNYQQHNDNQHVPIIKFEEGLLTLVDE